MNARGCAFVLGPPTVVVLIAVVIVGFFSFSGWARTSLGIICALVGLYFFIATVRMCPPGTYRPMYLHRSTGREILAGFAVAAVLLGVGVLLLRF